MTSYLCMQLRLKLGMFKKQKPCISEAEWQNLAVTDFQSTEVFLEIVWHHNTRSLPRAWTSDLHISLYESYTKPIRRRYCAFFVCNLLRKVPAALTEATPEKHSQVNPEYSSQKNQSYIGMGYAVANTLVYSKSLFIAVDSPLLYPGLHHKQHTAPL
jgi:hypothetical protein